MLQISYLSNEVTQSTNRNVTNRNLICLMKLLNQPIEMLQISYLSNEVTQSTNRNVTNRNVTNILFV